MSQRERHDFIHNELAPSMGFTAVFAMFFGCLWLPIWMVLPSVIGLATWAGWRTMNPWSMNARHPHDGPSA